MKTRIGESDTNSYGVDIRTGCDEKYTLAYRNFDIRYLSPNIIRRRLKWRRLLPTLVSQQRPGYIKMIVQDGIRVVRTAQATIHDGAICVVYSLSLCSSEV